MKYLRHMSRWFTSRQKSVPPDKHIRLTELQDLARRAQFAEQYNEAIKLLNEAYEIAQALHNTTAQVDIQLTRGDILVIQERWQEAERWLTELRQHCASNQHQAPLAYTLCSLGTIAQAQDRLDDAQHYYEKARAIAQSIGTDGASGRAIAHLADVYLQEGNASYAIHLLEDALPRLDRSGDRELLGYFLGRHGQALIESGQVSRGMAQLRRGLEAAIALKHRRQVRYLSLLLGQETIKVGDYQRAQQCFNDGLRLYPDPPPQSTSYAEALCHMSYATLHVEGAQAAKPYSEQAISVAKALNAPRILTLAKATQGLVLQKEGHSKQAIPILTEALTTYSSAQPDSFYLDILRGLATAQHQTGDAEAAFATYHQAVEQASAAPTLAAQLHDAMGHLCFEDHRYKDAIQHWREAIALFQDAKQRNQVLRLLCDVGTAYTKLGDGRLARREYEQALEQVNRTDDRTTRGIVLTHVAQAYQLYGELETAEAFFTEALEIARRANNPKEEVKRRCKHAHFLLQIGQANRAITELMQIRNRSQELNLPLQEALCNNYLGLAYTKLANYEIALKQHRTALAQIRILAERQWQAVIQTDMADSLYEAGNIDEAQQMYAGALAAARDLQYVVVIGNALHGLARIALDADELDVATSHLHDAELLAHRAHNRRLMAEVLTQQSRLYAKQTNLAKAQSTWEEAKKLRQMMRMPDIPADWI